MDILITGGRGQLGTELKKILECGRSELGEIPCELQAARCICVDADELDIADAASVEDFFSQNHFDLVFNCAAMTNVNGCESNRDLAMRVNAIGARNIAVQAERAGAKLVHVSTDYVFSGEGTTPFSEWDQCAPQSVYGKSKWLGEQYVQSFCSRFFIVRTSWLYGYAGANFVKTIEKIAREKGVLQVVNDQFGNPTNAADLAYHLLKIAVTQEYGIYHCTGKGICSWYDFACEIVKDAGVNCEVNPCTTEEYPTPAKRPAYSALDHQMLRCTVGDDMRDWKVALKCYFDNRENGGKTL